MLDRSTELRIPRSPAEIEAVHALRERRLFLKYHPPGTRWWVPYDRDHPDGRNPLNETLALVSGNRVLATARLDGRQGGEGVVRLVATAEDAPPGTGTLLMSRLADRAIRRGMSRLFLNAQGAVVGFYARLGWLPTPWSGMSSDPRAVPMSLELGPGQECFASPLAAFPCPGLMGRAEGEGRRATA